MMERLRSFFLRPSDVSTIPAGQEVAWAETVLFRAFDDRKYNPDELMGRKGSSIYRKMMVDEQVKAVVKFKRDAITSRSWFFQFDDDVELSDEEQQRRIDIYKKMINCVLGSFNDGLNYVMSGMYNGFSMTEIVIDVFEHRSTPYIGFSKLSPKPFDSFKFQVDRLGRIEQTIQELDGEEQTIDLSKFIYYVHNPEYDQHYGQSDLREAYRSWYSKDVIIKLYNSFLERLAGGLVEAKPKDGTTLKVNSPDYKAIKAIIDSIQGAGGVLLPSNIELTLHQPKATDQFEKAITMHDLQIAKALLVPNLLGVTHQGDTGSFAQADRQLEAFLWTLDSDANRLSDTLNEQLFDPLSILNFADGIGPKFFFEPVSDEKKMAIIETWKDLVNAGAAEATDTDEAHIRELLDFPEAGEPIKDPAPVLPGNSPGPGGGVAPGEPGQPETPRSGETVIGEEKRIISNQAFTRALKRVSFTVIDRKSTDLQERHTLSIEASMADMLANLVTRIDDEKLGTPAGSIDAIGKLDFATRDKSSARRSVDASLREAWRLGVRHSRDEIAKARRESTKLDMARIDEDAAEFLKTSGFRMFGNLSDSMRSIIQNILMNGIKFSWTTNDITTRIYDSLVTAGLIALTTNTAATGREEDEVLEALQGAKVNEHRIRTAVRTNTFEAINEARYSAFTDPELDGFVEALEYSAILDARTTDICTHLDGRIYPADSEHWNSVRPPNHHNCRSLLVPVTIVDTDVTGKDKAADSRWSRAPRKEPQKGFGGETG